MEQGQDLFEVIAQQQSKFSKGQRRIAEYIQVKYEKAAFMTANKLGKAVGVSESTVVRFATLLGYSGYPSLQKAMQKMIRNKLTAVQRVEVTEDQIGQTDVISKVMTGDLEKIRKTLENTSHASFEQAVDLVTHANNIYILGVRSSAVLAKFLSFYLQLIFPAKVRMLEASSGVEMFEQLLSLDQKDVFIAISFPRYSNRTVQACQFAKNRGAKVLAVTDCEQSPLVSHCDEKLLAPSDMASFVDSLVAPLSLLNALVVAVGMKKRTEVSETFSQLEQIWEEYQIYEKGGPQK